MNKEKNENEHNSKLEKLVNEVIIRKRMDKNNLAEQYTVLKVPQTTIYRNSYQVSSKTFQLFLKEKEIEEL